MLFVDEPLTSHSGLQLDFKIECDNLSDEEIELFARLISKRIHFRYVEGVPEGGLRLAKALEKYQHKMTTNGLLIVDDVFTTGLSMEQSRAEAIVDGTRPDLIVGCVLFARAPTPNWIIPLFGLWPKYNHGGKELVTELNNTKYELARWKESTNRRPDYEKLWAEAKEQAENAEAREQKLEEALEQAALHLDAASQRLGQNPDETRSAFSVAQWAEEARAAKTGVNKEGRKL